jgi:hypothetical protein
MMKTLSLSLAFVLFVLAAPRLAQADDGGAPEMCQADEECLSNWCNNGMCVPLACDGGLCDTTNESQCDVGAVGAPGSAAFVVGTLLVALALVRRRRSIVAALLAASGTVSAAPPLAVDVKIHDKPPPQRYVAIDWNPIPAFTLGKASFDVIITPGNHHALVLSPFYASTTTASFATYDAAGNPTVLPKQSFQGFGGELGYRYYFGLAGPRGFFLGGSFIFGQFWAQPQIGSSVSYQNLGGAIDAGYQMLVADHVLIAAGLGVQYTVTDKSIPNQQFPASIYANSGFNPRALVSVGWAF